jgi:predicted oxidoreductase
MLDGSLDHMQVHNIRPMAWNPLGNVFREDSEQTRRLKKVLVRLTEKYEVGADILLLSWIKHHPSNIIPVAGTVNVARIQQLQKIEHIKWDIEDWFEIWADSMGNKVP